jgi:hypothetical protein
MQSTNEENRFKNKLQCEYCKKWLKQRQSLLKHQMLSCKDKPSPDINEDHQKAMPTPASINDVKPRIWQVESFRTADLRYDENNEPFYIQSKIIFEDVMFWSWTNSRSKPLQQVIKRKSTKSPKQDAVEPPAKRLREE